MGFPGGLFACEGSEGSALVLGSPWLAQINIHTRCLRCCGLSARCSSGRHMSQKYPPAATFGNSELKLYGLHGRNPLSFCFLPPPPTPTLHILNSSSHVTGVTVFPLGSIQCGSLSADRLETSVNPLSCFNTIDGNSLFTVATGQRCGAGKNMVSFLQKRPSSQEAPGCRDKLGSN